MEIPDPLLKEDCHNLAQCGPRRRLRLCSLLSWLFSVAQLVEDPFRVTGRPVSLPGSSRPPER